MLRVWLCDRVAAELDGESLALPTSERARALLAWLALHPGPRPRSEIASQLWPSASEAQARANLRTAIWALRQAWGDPASAHFASSRTSFGLRPDELWVDAAAADQAVAPVGALLPGVHDDWAEEARRTHLERSRQRLDRLGRQAEREGRVTDAVEYARERCALDPLDETAHRDLMRRLAAAGDRAGALLVARQFAERLGAELGVAPSAATRAAEAELRGAAPAAARTQLFGRGAELAVLRAAWKSAASGEGQVVVLTGEAGIGKTSLLAELAHRVTTSGARTALGTGIDVDGGTPFAAWLEVAQALAQTVAPVPEHLTWPADLTRLSAELGARLGHPGTPTALAAPELERLRVFESVLRLVEWSCADRPLLLGIDDADRVDRASLRLTAHVGRRLSRLPALLVLTRRDRPARPELDLLLADLVSAGVRLTDVQLGPLGDREMEALATSVARLDDEAVRRVVSAAEGNPLLGAESARALAAGSGPPANLRTAVRASLAALPREAQRLAQLLAAAGRPLSRDELDRVTASEPWAESAGIETGLLSRTPRGLGFRHGLFRDAVYGDLLDPASMHDVLARILDRADHAELARHLVAAGRPAEAAREWCAAAAHARSVGALAEAADFLVRATECAPADGRLWLELEEVRAWQGRDAEMEQAWDRAVAQLPAEELPAAWSRKARQFRTVRCNPEASLRASRMAESLLGPQVPDSLRAEVLIGLAWAEAVGGDPERAEGRLAEAVALLPAPLDADDRIDITEIRLFGLIRQGRFAEGGTLVRDAGAGELTLRHPRGFGALTNAACALSAARDFEGALELAEQAVEACQSAPVLLVGALAARAQLLARLGRHEEARATARQQRTCAERLDSPTLVATAAHDAGMVALAGGQHREAAVLLAQALAGEPTVSRPAARLALAEALVRSGDPEAAADQVRAAALEPVRPSDRAWALVPRMAGVQGLIAVAQGDNARAARHFEEAARGWRGLLAGMVEATSEDFFATMVDLGRPPVLGLVEPDRELEAIQAERAALGDVAIKG